MNKASLRRAFIVFHLTLAVVVFIESVMTAVHAVHSPADSHLDLILPWFAGLEALAAVLLVIPKTLKIGGWTLLVIFAAAIVIHGPVHQLALFAFAAGVIFILAHGSAYTERTEPGPSEANPSENTR